MAELALEAALVLSDTNKAFYISSALLIKGRNLRDQAQWQTASECFEEAIIVLENTLNEGVIDEKTTKDMLMKVLNAASINFRYYNLNQSLAVSMRSAELANELEDQDFQSATSENIGVTYFQLRDFERALSWYEEASEWHEQLDDQSGKMADEFHIGSIYFVEGEIEKAISHFKISLDIADATGDSLGAADIYMELGHSYYALGQYDKALNYLKQSLLLLRSDRLGDYQGLIYIYLADVYAAQENFAKAKSNFEKVLNTYGAETLISPYGVFWRAHYGLAKLALYENNIDRALEHLRAAVNIIENERDVITSQILAIQFQNNQDKLKVYQDIVTLLINLGKQQEAFEYLERAKARSFLDQISNQHIAFRGSPNPKQIQQEQILRQQILDLQKAIERESAKSFDQQNPKEVERLRSQLEKIQVRYEELLTQMQLKNPEYLNFIVPQVLTLEQVQNQTLDRSTSLLEYFILEDKILVWIIDQKGFTVVSLNMTRENLSNKIKFSRNLIVHKEFDTRLASELYNVLFAPLKPYIHNSNLIIVPHGLLHYLPFAALWNATNERYLIEDYEITYAPSASVLPFILDKRNENQGRILVMGNPDRSLPHSEAEVDTVAQVYNRVVPF